MRAWPRRPAFWLIVVALAYAAVMLIVVAPHTPLGSDEALYASEVSPRVPALPFTAPRARGISWLIAPLVHVTASTAALRSYLAVLSSIALVLAYWPWLRAVHRPWLVPLAALLFAGMWTALFYGADDMPDIWVAFAAVAAVGWFVRYVLDRNARCLIGLATGIVVMALMRPGDAFWILVTLVIATLLVRQWRTPSLLSTIIGAAVVGVAPWVIEAYLRYGGLFARLRKASQEQGGLGLHPHTVLYTVRALTGPTLCRPCSVPSGHFRHLGTDLYVLWWLAIPTLAAVGAVAARRDGRWAALAMPAACGAVIGAFYLLTVDYSAPRFLLPAYALLALPMAAGIAHLVRRGSGRATGVAAAVAGALIIAELAAQVVVLHNQAEQPGVTRVAAVPLATFVHRPCLLAGVHRTQLAYLAGCHSVGKVSAHALRRARARGKDVAVLSGRSHPPPGFAGWRRVRLPIAGEHWYAYVPPNQG